MDRILECKNGKILHYRNSRLIEYSNTRKLNYCTYIQGIYYRKYYNNKILNKYQNKIPKY